MWVKNYENEDLMQLIGFVGLETDNSYIIVLIQYQEGNKSNGVYSQNIKVCLAHEKHQNQASTFIICLQMYLIRTTFAVSLTLYRIVLN